MTIGYNAYGATAGYGGAGGSGGSDWLQWIKDNPQAAAAIAGVVGQAASTLTANKGNVQWKQVPETAEEKAYRIYAENLAGMHGTASPTYAYLGPQINNQLQTIQANSAAYQGLNKIDPATGQMIQRAPVATPPPIDFSKLPQPWAHPTASLGSGTTTNTNGAPPPPPVVNTSGFEKARKKNVLKKALGGLASGFVNGFLGSKGNAYAGAATGLIGEYQGGKAANATAQQKWDAAYADYNQWKALYGNSFTDAQGRPVKAPTNLNEYNAWYVSKYGTQPPAPSP